MNGIVPAQGCAVEDRVGDAEEGREEAGAHLGELRPTDDGEREDLPTARPDRRLPGLPGGRRVGLHLAEVEQQMHGRVSHHLDAARRGRAPRLGVEPASEADANSGVGVSLDGPARRFGHGWDCNGRRSGP